MVLRIIAGTLAVTFVLCPLVVGILISQSSTIDTHLVRRDSKVETGVGAAVGSIVLIGLMMALCGCCDRHRSAATTTAPTQDVPLTRRPRGQLPAYTPAPPPPAYTRR